MESYTTRSLTKLHQKNISNIQQMQCPLRTIIDKFWYNFL